MAHPHSYSSQTYPHQTGHNTGPSGDVRLNQASSNLPPPLPPQQNGLTQPMMPQNYRGYMQANSINGEISSPQVMGQKSGEYASPQSYHNAVSSSFPHGQVQVPNRTSDTRQYPVASNNPPMLSQHHAHSAAAQPPPTAPQYASQKQQTHPLSQSVASSPFGNGPPLPPGASSHHAFKPIGQHQDTSSTPPPTVRHPHASAVQGPTASNARSTPTYSIPPPPITNEASQSYNALPPAPQPQSMSSSDTSSVPVIPTQQFAYGGIAPPPLPGHQYLPPKQKELAPPPLPGQQYVFNATASSQPISQPNRSYASAVAPPPPFSQPGHPAATVPGGMSLQNTGSLGFFLFLHQNENTPRDNCRKASYPQTQQHSLGRSRSSDQGHYKNAQPALAGPNQATVQGISSSMADMNLNNAKKPINLLQEVQILPPHKPVENPLRFETTCDRSMLIPPDRKNCHPDVLRCTLKAIPHTQNLLQKVKLPLGLVVHPFKDLSSLPVISAGTIVRCKRCRTYVNPFVSFIDERRWRCNMCFSVNDVPEEFLHHPVTKTYGEPHTRPECTNSTIEFIAPQEYMLRPPQPAVYMFLMDVSHSAIETGYLPIVCDALLEQLDRLPGDSRTQIGFLTYNQTVHFYRLNESLAHPQMLIVSDIDDVFVPTPENLLVNLRESKNLVQELLHQLPIMHNLDEVGEVDTYSALGAALEVAKKLMSSFGGRVTVFQQSLPSIGPGKLEAREDPNVRAGEVPTPSLNPATDFYKKMALDCSAHQVAVDFFFMNSHYVDIATLSCSSRFSAGDVHYYPSLHVLHNPMEADRLSRDLERYLSRKIGFESVMRIRCTKGLNIHTFHGNFFVRSTDLLALANTNPDAGFAVNLSIEEPLTDLSAVCFQAALLYTTSKGERRIRVHTMCVPVVKTPSDVLNAVDCVAVVSLLSKMAVDRSVTASISDARDALVNAVIDPLKTYKETLPPGMTTGGVYVPPCLRLFPLYIHSLTKHVAFRSGVSTKLDDRVFAMINFKMQPASYFLQDIHPDLYRVDDLNDEGCIQVSSRDVPQPSLLPLSAESLTQSGCFLLDCGWSMYLLVGRSTKQVFIKDVLGYPQFSNIDEPMYGIPEQENPMSELFQSFIEWLQEQRPHHAPIRVIRDDSRERILFFSHLRQDRFESSKSLQDFLLHVQQKLN